MSSSSSSSSCHSRRATTRILALLLVSFLLLSTLTTTAAWCGAAFIAQQTPVLVSRRVSSKQQQQQQQQQQLQSLSSRRFVAQQYATVIPVEGDSTEESTNKKKKHKRSPSSLPNQSHEEQNHLHLQQQSSQQQPPPLSASQIESRIVTLGRQGKTLQALNVFEALERPTIRQVNAAIDACARARPAPQLERAFDILQTKCSGGNKDSSRDNNKDMSTLPRPNVYTFGSLMSACARAGRVDLCLDLLQTMQDAPYHVAPNAVVYNTAVSACDKAHPPQPATALRLLQEASDVHGLHISVVGYNAAASAAARAGDWRGAVRLLERMENGNQNQNQQPGVPSIPRPDAVTYGTILSAFERAEEWEQLMAFAEKIKNNNNNNIQLDGMALTSILHACQRLGLAQQAVYYLQEMKNLAHSHPVERSTAGWQVAGHRPALLGPDAVAYLLAISASARGGAWTQGIELLEEYLREHPIVIVPNNATTDSSLQQQQQQQHAVALYTAAISGCEYAGEWQAAFGLLDRMRQAGVEPNEVTYTTVIGACATACSKFMSSSSSENYHRNKQVRHQHGDTGPPIPPLRHALRLLRILHNSNINNDNANSDNNASSSAVNIIKPNIQIYNAAIRACAEACDLNRAFRLLEMIRNTAGAEAAPHEDIRPNIVTYGTLMTACERVGSIEGMNKVFRLVHEEKDENGESLLEKNEVIYGAAISCCRKTGQSERAMLLLQKMIKEGLEPNVATFNTVLMAQTEASTKNAMRNGNGSSSSSSSSDDGAISSTAKDIERAVQVYNILKLPQRATSARPNRLTYNMLIRFLAENLLPREAEVLLQEMRKNANLVPDVHLYTSVVASYERTRQPLRALRLMESMNEDGYDFYEVKVLNAAFKRALKLANAVVGGVGGVVVDDDDEDARRETDKGATDAKDWSYNRDSDLPDETGGKGGGRRSNYNFLAGFNKGT
jgi:pentatricopeptide repeat protein